MADAGPKSPENIVYDNTFSDNEDELDFLFEMEEQRDKVSDFASESELLIEKPTLSPSLSEKVQKHARRGGELPRSSVDCESHLGAAQGIAKHGDMEFESISELETLKEKLELSQPVRVSGQKNERSRGELFSEDEQGIKECSDEDSAGEPESLNDKPYLSQPPCRRYSRHCELLVDYDSNDDVYSSTSPQYVDEIYLDDIHDFDEVHVFGGFRCSEPLGWSGFRRIAVLGTAKDCEEPCSMSGLSEDTTSFCSYDSTRSDCHSVGKKNKNMSLIKSVTSSENEFVSGDFRPPNTRTLSEPKDPQCLSIKADGSSCTEADNLDSQKSGKFSLSLNNAFVTSITTVEHTGDSAEVTKSDSGKTVQEFVQGELVQDTCTHMEDGTMVSDVSIDQPSKARKSTAEENETIGLDSKSVITDTTEHGIVSDDQQKISAWHQKPWQLDQIEFSFFENMVAGTYTTEAVKCKTEGRKKNSKSKTYALPRTLHGRQSRGDTGDFQGMAEIMAQSPLIQLAKQAEEKGYDLGTLIEFTDSLPEEAKKYSPCMQCLEQTRRYSYRGHYVQNGRCCSCGAKMESIGGLGKRILKLKDVFAEKDLVAHDVYPDGNCQFSAVIDQLRMQGNFCYTVPSLRRAAVNFLRDHPYTDEDTHLEQFLADESWEQYLERMSCDGEWGDHMVLRAISSVTDMRIVVYGSTTGDVTVLLPHRFGMEDKDEAKSSDIDVPTICLGHFTDTHYISARPCNWRTALLEKAASGCKSKNRLVYGMFHIDNIVKKILQLDYLTSVSVSSSMNEQDHDFHGEVVGHIASLVCPKIEKIQSFMPSINLFFPKEVPYIKDPKVLMTVFLSPKDTYLQEDATRAGKMDLVIEKCVQGLGEYFRLIPKKANCWTGQTVEYDGKSYLKGTSTCRHIPKPGVDAEFFEVLAFQCDWPMCAEEWMRRERVSNVPTQEQIRDIVVSGCHAIAVSDYSCLEDVLDYNISVELSESGTIWCYSFATAERDLFRQFLTQHQRMTFLMFKFLVDRALCNCPLPSSVVKSVFFYACESLPVDDWQSQPGSCVMKMLQKLAYGLEIGCISHYFISHVNLLNNIEHEHLQNCTEKVTMLKNHILLELYIIMDSAGIMNSETGLFIDEMFEDIVSYSSHGNILQSFTDTMIPASKTLIKTLIKQREFEYALRVLEDFKEQLGLYTGENDDFFTAMYHTTCDLPPGEEYCFAFYIDYVRKTDLVGQICSGYEQYSLVPLSTLFGGDLPKWMLDKPVMSLYSIPTGQLLFPQCMVDVLKQCGLEAILAKALRFYLDSYAEIAGDGLVLNRNHSQAASCRTVCPCSMVYLKILFQLYTELLTQYKSNNQVEEFRPLMTHFALLVESLEMPTCYKWLGYAWEMLKEQEEADAAYNRCEQYQGGTFLSELMRTLQG